MRADPQDFTDVAAAVADFGQYKSDFDENASANKQALRDKIASAVSQRQLSVKAYRGLVAQGGDLVVQDGDFKLNEIKQSLASFATALGGAPTGIPRMPKFMEDLIENDLQNDDGFRSGKRYIIKDDVLLSMSLNINLPDFNRVDVQGNVDIVGKQLGGTGAIPQLFWAGAVDYDSWRQFGHKAAGQEVHRADFSDPETQCAPYAVFKLLQQRKKIHSGTVTVVGNEFYRPGDVVYVNAKSMLYYVETVTHDLNLDTGKFTTSLTLTYGKALGEYLPTPLDVIGKGVLSNKRRALSELKGNRKSVPSSSNVFTLDTLFVESYTSLAEDAASPGIAFDRRNQTKFIEQNRAKLKNAILRAASKINDQNQQNFNIEIRTYYVSETDILTGKLKPLSETPNYFKSQTISNWVVEEMISPTFNDQLSTTEQLATSKVTVKNIDIAGDLLDKDRELRRFPSSQAWSGAARSGSSVSGVSLPTNAIDIVFVVDNSRAGDKEVVSLKEKAARSLSKTSSGRTIINI